MIRAKFKPPAGDDFDRSLRKKVRLYFKENKIEKTGNSNLYFKTFLLFLFLLGPLFLLFVLPKVSLLVYVSTWLLMGVAMAGIGLAVMHDSVHGAFSNKRGVNDFIGHFSMFFIGGFVANWRIQHNQLHHTFTNLKDLDEDINPPFNLLRLSPDYPKEKKHRLQHIYAWFLYLAMTAMWCTTKDFKQILRFKKAGFYDNRTSEYRKEWTRLVLFKLGYFVFFLALPTWLTPYSFGQILSGFLLMHAVAGFILAIVFQPAHITPSSDFPKLNSSAEIEDSWAAHQMITTQNFAMSSRWLTWYVGGLNYQIEHHLFPHVSHVHYPKISALVQETAKEYNLPYYHTPTFLGAVVGHGKMLYELGHS